MAMEDTEKNDRYLTLTNFFNILARYFELETPEERKDNQIEENLRQEIVSFIHKNFITSVDDLWEPIIINYKEGDKSFIKRLFSEQNFIKIMRLLVIHSAFKNTYRDAYTYRGDKNDNAYLTTLEVRGQKRDMTIYGFLFYIIRQNSFNKSDAPELYQLIDNLLKGYFSKDLQSAVMSSRIAKRLADNYFMPFSEQKDIGDITKWVDSYPIIDFLKLFYNHSPENNLRTFRSYMERDNRK